jgi:hypothetical protein
MVLFMVVVVEYIALGEIEPVVGGEVTGPIQVGRTENVTTPGELESIPL